MPLSALFCLPLDFFLSFDLSLTSRNYQLIFPPHIYLSIYKVTVSNHELLLTYGEFLENHTSTDKPQRKTLKTTFTAPGAIGENCLPSLQLLHKAMMTPSLPPVSQLPVSSRSSPSVPYAQATIQPSPLSVMQPSSSSSSSTTAAAATTQSTSSATEIDPSLALCQETLSSGQYHIVPSFLRLVTSLVTHPQHTTQYTTLQHTTHQYTISCPISSIKPTRNTFDIYFRRRLEFSKTS